MLHYLQDVYTKRAGKSPRFTVHFDFRKAFDSVPHSMLVQNLANFGFGNNFLQLIVSYLSGRTQRVKIIAVLSSVACVSSWVPQGSILGTLLFLIFVNDLPKEALASTRFADDSKLLSTYSLPELQSHIDRFWPWTIKMVWILLLN